MTWAPIIMAAVAGVLVFGGIVSLFAIRGPSGGAVYARRILATMLLTLAGILGIFAWSMAGWERGA